jgi:F0F1-type ATP synthase membrane subunit b/b'
MFDKAEQAETEAKAEHQLADVVEELNELKKQADHDDNEASKTRVRELEARRVELEAEVKRRHEQKKEESRDEETP